MQLLNNFFFQKNFLDQLIDYQNMQFEMKLQLQILPNIEHYQNYIEYKY